MNGEIVATETPKKDNDMLLLVLMGICIYLWWRMKNQEGGSQTTASNHESWEWIDYKGNERKMVITREVKVHD